MGVRLEFSLLGTLRQFAGREDELAALTGLLDQADQRAQATAVISAVGGTAGVGKTALAVHWARQVAPRFPDGQLYVNLRGYDVGSPMPPEDALAGFLRTLGVSGQDIPAGLDECAARYRSLLAGRRMLVLLDNARSAEQVRPLLPASAGCMTVVTSRDAMAGLVARERARRIELDLLPLPDAAGLLRMLIGERAAADPGATRALAEGCSRLPLALRVAAERAIATPGTSLASLVAELTDERRSLDLPDADGDPRTADGDPRTAVRAVFSWSYRHLPEAAARAFRLAALHPGPDLDVYSVAALTGGTLEQAGPLLGQLVRAGLIQPSGPARNSGDRYTRHDLLRAYGRELAMAADAESERRAALTRLFDYYLHAASAATSTLYPADQNRRPDLPRPDLPRPDLPRPDLPRPDLPRPDLPRPDLPRPELPRPELPRPELPRPDLPRPDLPRPDLPRPAGPVPPLATPAAARAWLDAERASLVAVSAHAARRGWPGHASRLAVTLHRYLDTGGYFSEAVTVHNAGRRAARRVGDRGAIAEALNSLGRADLRQGRYQQAIGRFQQAHAHFRAIGHKSGEARALGNLGIVAMHQGGHQEAARHLELAAVLLRQTGDQAGQAMVLNGLGSALLSAGRVADAHARHTEALVLARKLDDSCEQARAHNGLGHAEHALGDLAEARRQWQQALALYTRLGSPEADQIRGQLAKMPDLAARSRS
jgi:tetratricopeptide (TPR) repeat protein